MMSKSVKVELCQNVEWLSQHIVNECPEGWETEVAAAYQDAAWRHIYDAGVAIESARGQRSLYHGWNGDQFHSYQIGGLMVFGALTPELEKLVDDADTTGRDAAEKLAAEIVAKNADESEESDSSIYDLIQTLTDRLNSLASASPESSLAMVAGDAIEALKTLSWELQDHEIKG